MISGICTKNMDSKSRKKSAVMYKLIQAKKTGVKFSMSKSFLKKTSALTIAPAKGALKAPPPA